MALIILPYLLQVHFQNCVGVNSGCTIKWSDYVVEKTVRRA